MKSEKNKKEDFVEILYFIKISTKDDTIAHS